MSQLYRVRDKNYPGRPGHVWGEALTFDEADKLREDIIASRQSKTARVESMDVPGDSTMAPAPAPRPSSPQHPSNALRRKPDPVPEHLRGEKQAHPYLESIRQTALGAVSGEAAKAQQRADALARRRNAEADLARANADANSLDNNLPIDFVNEDPAGVPPMEDELLES